MAILYADRVKDTSTSTGTGNLTLSGSAPTGFQTFNAGLGVGPSFYYAIEGGTASEWEVGMGHLSSATTLVRDQVKASSNSNALVNFTAGTQTVFCTAPAFTLQDDPSRGQALVQRAYLN